MQRHRLLDVIACAFFSGLIGVALAAAAVEWINADAEHAAEVRLLNAEMTAWKVEMLVAARQMRLRRAEMEGTIRALEATTRDIRATVQLMKASPGR